MGLHGFMASHRLRGQPVVPGIRDQAALEAHLIYRQPPRAYLEEAPGPNHPPQCLALHSLMVQCDGLPKASRMFLRLTLIMLASHLEFHVQDKQQGQVHDPV